MIYTDAEIAKKYLNKINDCSKNNIEFSLSLTQWKNIWSRKRCPYTCRVLGRDGHDKATVDRIDPSLGYVTGNVIVCTSWVNFHKANLTVDVFKNIIKIQEKAKKT